MQRIRHLARRLAMLTLLGVGAALAGCAAPAPQAALVAKSTAGDYGYSDTKLSDTRYEMVYESPELSISVDGSERARELEAERKRAYDFALWHAAETAKARGFAALKVEKERRDADVSLQRERTYSTWPGYYGPFYGHYYGYPYPYRYGPWGYDDFCCGPVGYQRWASARITVVLQVLFLREVAEGALPVEETLAQLASRYGTPTYP
jgi:hypothetical protein